LSNSDPLEVAVVSDSFTILSLVFRVRPMPAAIKSPTLPEVVVVDGCAVDGSMPAETDVSDAEPDIDTD
jgi:hypothetical protein